ncbi:MAG: hypothetical protein ACRECI_09540 [Methyloceanibacter sp.]
MSNPLPIEPADASRIAPETKDSQTATETGVHTVVAEIAVGAALWFIVMAWLDFARGGEIDYLLVIVTLFFVMFFGLFLLTASYTLHDPRWPLRDTSFREFLRAKVGTATGTMRGRDALIEIALVPVSLAFAATVIGLVWSALH